MDARPGEAPYIVKPVSRALRLLRALGEIGHDQTLSEVCRSTGLPKSTAFKYLRTLLDAGYVDHDPRTDTYRVGLVVWELAQSLSGRLRVREIALPFMRALSGRFGETVNLGVLDGRQIAYVEVVGPPSLAAAARCGHRGPVYSTALGKAMLAALPDEEWRAQVPARLTPRTPRTLASFGALHQDLVVTRQRRFALDRGESEDGMWCAAAAVIGPRGAVAGAISVSAPTCRLTADRRRRITEAVCESAGAASRRMGQPPNASGSPLSARGAISRPRADVGPSGLERSALS